MSESNAGSRTTVLRSIGVLAERPVVSEVGLPALTVTFGLQVLRVLIPGLTWTLGDRFDLGAVYLGIAALAVFLTAFLAGGLRRLLGSSRAIAVTAGGLGLTRLLMQVWWGEPLFNLVLAMVGTALFVMYLPIGLDESQLSLDESQRRSNPAAGHFVLGLLLGLALDTALHSAFLTYDTVWQSIWPALLVTALLVVFQWLLLAGGAASRSAENGPSVAPKLSTTAWLFIGPFFFLQLVVLQNVARLAAVTGWRLPLASGWVVFGQVVALAAVVWLLGRQRRSLWPIALVSGGVLIVITLFSYPEPGWFAALTVFGGQISSALLLVMLAVTADDRRGPSGFGRLVAGNGVGMILLVVLLLGYYVVYQMSLPYSNTILEIVAASLMTLCVLLSTARLRDRIGVSRRSWLLPVLAVVLLMPSLVGAVTWEEPAPVSGNGFPVRVMTYNLHNGFNPEGYLGMEALAMVIEESRPDIVALQEVSRGWVISGRVDMLTWLSQRLDMPYVSGPTADPLWGNVILSRYPIIEYENHELPPRDLFILRGFTSAMIDLGDGNRLRVIATHFHHLEGDSEVRQVQSASLVQFLDGTGNTIVLGDFNAGSAAPEMETLRQAGLIDAAGLVDSSPADTFTSINPYQRIDYVWVSADLKVSRVFVPVTTASDHLPVIAVIDR